MQLVELWQSAPTIYTARYRIGEYMLQHGWMTLTLACVFRKSQLD